MALAAPKAHKEEPAASGNTRAAALTLVIHQPNGAPFDETIDGEELVDALVERVRRRLCAQPEARVRLICAGAVLLPSITIAKAVRARAGVSVYHIHCAHTPPVASPEEEHEAAANELTTILPNHHVNGLQFPVESEHELVVLSMRARQADFIWGFSLGLVLGVLTLFILVDRAMPRMMQSGILLGISCNMLFGYGGTINSVRQVHGVQDDDTADKSVHLISRIPSDDISVGL
ncbi:hypothetical protein AB1Y20_003279 [Prymnesium parvum]|uniref:DSC E3 ubiquitin ligase complex subunit 3 C-terminal domain-containing protein n=1 Tax=Prymnesium parvum TaxID=97485 RepID=A0AB34JDL5_PRYPA